MAQLAILWCKNLDNRPAQSPAHSFKFELFKPMKPVHRIVIGGIFTVCLMAAFSFLFLWPRSGEEDKATAAVLAETPSVVKDPQSSPQIDAKTTLPLGPEATPAPQVARRVATRDPEALLQTLKRRSPDSMQVVLPTTLILVTRSSDPFAAARHISTMQDETTRNAYILRLAPLLGAKDSAATLDWLGQVASGDSYKNAVSKTIAALAANDPKAAAVVVDKISDSGVRLEAISTVAGSWGKADPQSALTWAASLPATDGQAQSVALNAIVASWSKSDPAGVASFVQKASDPTLFLPADPAIAQSLAANNAQAAMAFSQSLPAGEAKNQSLNNVIATIAKSDFATAWNDATSLPAAEDSIGIMTNLVGVQANSDPAQAAALIPLFPNETGQTAAATTLAAIWVKQNPQAFTVWLDGLPVSAVRDAAIVQLVSSSQATKNPEGVMAWVNTVSNPEMKAALVQKLNQAQSAGK